MTDNAGVTDSDRVDVRYHALSRRWLGATLARCRRGAGATTVVRSLDRGLRCQAHALRLR
jgi:hypothetical protein